MIAETKQADKDAITDIAQAAAVVVQVSGLMEPPYVKSGKRSASKPRFSIKLMEWVVCINNANNYKTR